MKRILYAVGVLLFANLKVLAQTHPIPNSTWELTYQIDQISGDTIKYDGVFVVGKTEIGWGPNKKSLAKFAIESSEGIWKRKKSRGLVTYNISFADFVGTAKFIGKKEWLIIEIVLEFGESSSKTKLFAKSVKYN